MTDTERPIRPTQNADAVSVAEPSTKTLKEEGLSNSLNLVPEQHSSKVNLENGSDGHAEVQNESSSKTHRFDPDFTQNVIDATGPKARPRMRKVMGSLIQHIHDFARENEITVNEWMAGVELVCITSCFISGVEMVSLHALSGNFL